ncbi:MAG TPA: DUF5777 family beta-barrel protein [Bacteroidia bacterium]|nr:DUF5777 family beta-barrel protein [Bacteroidia bacterium]HNU33330.1 DUF5777 family beta-barrel protein [Bacteroidia bacterium]
MQTRLILFFLIFYIKSVSAQQPDLLSLVEDEKQPKEFVKNSYKSTRVIMSHSLENLAGGVLDFRILHRFGMINEGAYQFFGLDQATIRLGLDYAVTDRLTVGIGRSSYKKEVDGFAKYKLLWQATGPKSSPVSVIYVGGTTVNGLKFEDEEVENYFTSRLGYYHQLIIGRKFSESLTLQIAPTFLHLNIVPETLNRHDIYGAQLGGRIKLTKRLALTADYVFVANGKDGDVEYKHPLSIGFDIETGGHVFQLHFTNATGMNERAFITETQGDWGKGDIQFGFNISRVFTIKDKRKK